MYKKYITKSILYCTGRETKLWKILKLSILFILLGMAYVKASASILQINLSLKNVAFEKALRAIAKQSGYDVLYSPLMMEKAKPVSLELKNVTLETALEKCFENQPLTYSINKRAIAVKEKPVNSNSSLSIHEQQVAGLKIQQIAISGWVQDTTGGIQGVSVSVKGNSRIGTVTDDNGQFHLMVPKSNSVLVFSRIGYELREIPLEGKTELRVQLNTINTDLEEVVVVGYGSVKRKDLTGAVSSVRTKDLPPAANTSIAHMLAGRAAGLTAVQQSAQPGGFVSMQIRGQSSNRAPLVVIDGFAQTGFNPFGDSKSEGGYVGNPGQINGDLNSINPNDIESIEVLKDASATSIYGARAAGGVILITTKRGKEGRAEVNYRGTLSTQRIYGLPKLLNPKDFMIQSNEAIKENWMRDNKVYPYGIKTLDQAIAEAQAANKPIWQTRYTDAQISNPPAGTDWLSLVTRNGSVQEHNLSVNGGTEKTKYMISTGYYDQEGVIRNNGMKRFTTRFNLDQKFSKYISAGITSNLSQIKNNNVPLGKGASENSGIIRASMQFNPLLPEKDDKGNYMINPLEGYIVNPASLLEIKDKSVTERLLMTSYLQVNPFEGFSVRALVGADRNQGKRNYYLPTKVLFGAREGGFASINNTAKTDYTLNVVANYLKNWGENSLSVMAGAEYQKFNWDGSGSFNSKFPYDGVLWYNLAAGARERPGVSSYGGSSEIASYFSRVNYSFMNRYLMTFNFRADGSSNFSENHRWGYFPGVALAWKVNEENFMKGTSSWLSELKLRAGYGQTGNDNVPGIYTYYGTGWNYILDGKITNGIGLNALGNPNLKWETQTDINVGLDFGLYGQRITGSVELFDRKVKDIIADKRLMSYQEVNTIKANLDAVKQSRGLEFSLRSNNISKPDFSWNTDLTLTYYRDRWKKRDPSFRPDINIDYNANFEELWSFLSDGIVSVNDTEYIKKFGAIPGTIKIKDVNGYKLNTDGSRVVDADGRPQYAGAPDGKIDNADLVKIGVNAPITIGLSNSFIWKGFDLNLYFYGMFNRWRVNDTRAYYSVESFRLRNGANMFDEVKERWSYANMDAKYPSIFQANASYGTGDFYLEKAWFIRCRNITLGYTLPKSVAAKVLKNARIFIDAQNPFVITPYSGTDPETDQMAAYPNQRTFSFGVDVKF